MKASELRHKNLVQLTEQARKDLFDNMELSTRTKVFPVVMIDTVFINLFIESQEIEFCYGDIQPIPITHEWLNKLGFKNPDGYYEIDLPHNFTLIEGDKNGYLEVFELNHDTLRCRYVHELQNLYFALSKHELTIKKLTK